MYFVYFVVDPVRMLQEAEGNPKMRRSRSLVLEALDGKVMLSAIPLPIAWVSPPSIAPVSQGLAVKLTTDHQVYHRGQPVVITLTETNTTQHEITVDSGPSPDGFIVSHNGREVWASNTEIQPMFVLAKTLEPGQSITQTATWYGHSNTEAAGTATGHLLSAARSQASSQSISRSGGTDALLREAFAS